MNCEYKCNNCEYSTQKHWRAVEHHDETRHSLMVRKIEK